LINCLQETGAVTVEPIDWSKGTAAMKIFEGLKKNMPPNLDYTSPIDFLMVVGDGRDDEVIFRWANELDRDGTVGAVTTVSLGSRNTEAGCTLTQGVTGTFISPTQHLQRTNDNQESYQSFKSLLRSPNNSTLRTEHSNNCLFLLAGS
jgi:trehalose-6-phosphatase